MPDSVAAHYPLHTGPLPPLIPYCPSPILPRTTRATHHSPHAIHHSPHTPHHSPRAADRLPLTHIHLPLPTHHSPLTTHPSRLASHDSRLPTHYSPSSLMLVILHDSPRPLTLTAHPSPLPLTSPSCHSTPSICCSLLTTHHSTFLRIANHLNMSDVCRSQARSIEGVLRAPPNVTRLPRDEIMISSACGDIPSLAAPARHSSVCHSPLGRQRIIHTDAPEPCPPDHALYHVS